MNFTQFMAILFYGIVATIILLLREKRHYEKKESLIIAGSSTVLALLMLVISNNFNKEKFDFISVIFGIITNFCFTYNLSLGKIQIKSFLRSAIVILLFFTSSIYQIIPIKLFNITEGFATFKLNTYLTAFSDVILLIILLLAYYSDLKKGILKLKKNFYELFDASFKIWLFGFLGMVISNLIINLVFPSAVAGNENTVQKMIDVSPFLMLICAGVVAPIIEELTFRQAFRDVLKNKYVFVIASGIIFGGLHVIFSYQNLIDLIYIIPYSLLGMSFAYMVDKTDNILSSIMMHFIHNTAIIIFSVMAGMIIL